ncbi:MAG: helix-turn-helix domain-containing protein [Clostridia bacterium]|nr:helix-turn-helix domain-containing protein [Clostridia bacterium]
MEKFLKIEELQMTNNMAMPSLHSHPYFEIYFLYEGKRVLFFENKLFEVEAPVVLVVPPHKMHKTEGGKFKRINLYVTANYLDDFQRDVLESLQLSPVRLTAEQAAALLDILKTYETLSPSDKNFPEIQKAKFAYFILTLYTFTRDLEPLVATGSPTASPLVIGAINYMNANYSDDFSLDDLCRELYTSKQTLIYHFKKHLDCSPMHFLLNLRMTKVKELLVTTNDSIEAIADSCGFSSGNYLALIFKRKEGISPGTYRSKSRAYFHTV